MTTAVGDVVMCVFVLQVIHFNVLLKYGNWWVLWLQVTMNGARMDGNGVETIAVQTGKNETKTFLYHFQIKIKKQNSL